MKTTWVVVADASRARILEADVARHQLHEIHSFVHPQGREHNRGLKTDGEGRYFGPSGQRGPGHTGTPEADPAEHELELFTKSLSEFLDKARSQNRYEALHLVAPPKVLGQIRHHLSKPALQLVSDTLPKDISWFNEHELERYLADKGIDR